MSPTFSGVFLARLAYFSGGYTPDLIRHLNVRRVLKLELFGSLLIVARCLCVLGMSKVG